MTEPTDPAAGPLDLPSRRPARPLLGMPDPDPGQAHTQHLTRVPAVRKHEAPPATPYGPLGTAEVYPPQPDADAPWPLVSGQPPRPRPRLGLVLIGLLIALVVGGLTAAFVLIGPVGDRGSGTPAQAVDGFLDGIYGTHSAKQAARFVCERARDDAALEQIVFQVRQLEDSYSSARTSWSYPPIEESGRQASAQVTLTMITANEQMATRTVTLLLVDDRGWWVCDVTPVEAAAG
jgi:hypothetical protein